MPAPQLTLNLSPIEFDDAEVRVGWLPYGVDGDTQLKSFVKTTTRLTCFVARDLR